MCGLFARDKQAIEIVNERKKSGRVLQNVRRLERAQSYGGGRVGVGRLVPRQDPDGPVLGTEGGENFLSSRPAPRPHPTSCTRDTGSLTG